MGGQGMAVLLIRCGRLMGVRLTMESIEGEGETSGGRVSGLIDLNFLIGFRGTVFHLPSRIRSLSLWIEETMIFMRVMRLILGHSHRTSGIFPGRCMWRVVIGMILCIVMRVTTRRSIIVATRGRHSATGAMRIRGWIRIGIQIGRRILGQLRKTGQVHTSSTLPLMGRGRTIGKRLAIIRMTTRIEAITRGRLTRVTGVIVIVGGLTAIHRVQGLHLIGGNVFKNIRSGSTHCGRRGSTFIIIGRREKWWRWRRRITRNSKSRRIEISVRATGGLLVGVTSSNRLWGVAKWGCR